MYSKKWMGKRRAVNWRKIMDDPWLGLEAKGLFGWIWAQATPPTRQQVQIRFNLSDRKTKELLRALREAGLIQTQQRVRHGERRWEYRAEPREHWLV